MKIITKSEAPINRKRLSLFKDWKKAKPDSIVEVCTHDNLTDWDCGCSWGCGSCDIRWHCKDCGCLINVHKLPTLKLV